MSKWTPGPWMTMMDRSVRAVESGGSNLVADVYNCPYDAATSGPNARLIAAAPELIEALAELVRINEEHNAAVEAVTGKPVGWKDSYLDRARAALEKAGWEG